VDLPSRTSAGFVVSHPDKPVGISSTVKYSDESDRLSFCPELAMLEGDYRKKLAR
jgi:hypothetical protein